MRRGRSPVARLRAGFKVLQLLWHRAFLLFLRVIFCAGLLMNGIRRVISAVIARNPRGVLATRVDQKGRSHHHLSMSTKNTDGEHF